MFRPEKRNLPISALELLQKEWIGFLQQRGHQVQEADAAAVGVVVSQSKKDNRFRWLLLVAEGQIKKLRPGEYHKLGQEYERAQKAGQKPYVVVYFAEPQPKVVIMPADRVLQTGSVGSARGGIAWRG